MCGISAIYSTNLSSSSTDTDATLNSQLRASIRAMQHRGPDSSGTYIDVSDEQVVGLAHARLSIIDLEGGHQPLHNDDNSVHAIVNGELYDYAKLREDLERKGCVFKSSVDSELVIHLYEIYGLDLLTHLRGEHAFVLYDQKRKLLFAARDRFGIKPLYYTLSDDGNTLRIASEMKALKPLGWEPQWDIESIVQMGDFNDNRTVFKGVHKLLPGHLLTFGQDRQLKVKSYWDHTFPSTRTPETRSIDEMIEGVRTHLVDAVRVRLRSDVPLGIYLSGGIDSAVVAGIAAKLLREGDPNASIDAFTLSFPGMTFRTMSCFFVLTSSLADPKDRAELDEGPIAQRMAESVGATLHLITPSEADLVNRFEQSVYHAEGPVHSMAGAGKLMLSEYVHKHGLKVVLTGEGSDEVFAGYSFYLWDFLRAVDETAVSLGTPLPSSSDLTRALAAKGPGKMPQDLLSINDMKPDKSLLGGIIYPSIWGAAGLSHQAFSHDVLEKTLCPDYPLVIAEGLNSEARKRIDAGELHPLHASMYTAAKTALPNFILNVLGERVEMANSVEGRPPFLDHRLVEYANTLPPSVKIMPILKKDQVPDSSSQIREWDFTEKWILRQAAKPFVTEEIYRRRKLQYNAPISRPSKTRTPLQVYLKDRLTDESVRRLGWANCDLVNTNKPTSVSSDLFEGQIVVNIKGFTDRDGQPTSSSYFDKDDRQGITWSFQVQGRFLKGYSADEILFGNTFDRPLHLPWGSSAALKFMNFVDPTLEHDLTSSTKPWALSPLITTMPHFVHTRLGGSPHASPASSSSSLGLPSSPPKFPPRDVVKDDTSMLYLAQSSPQWSPSHSASSSSSSLSSNDSYGSRKSSSSKNYNLLSGSKHKKRGPRTPINLETAGQRRSYFSSPENRQAVRFGPNDVITTDFCYGFLEFSPTISLRIPGGLSFDLMKYWDGQPVRFVCCERKRADDVGPDPWGRILWCVVIELCD
ncbi:hypothetical protein PQX77_005115 [Marasmius sp. AFHP31]|nr:hypothetical protein PQX77_005115 [Marasmius sp. AFHP31]